MYWTVAKYGALVVAGCLIGWTINGWRLGSSIASLKASYAEESTRVLVEVRNREKSLIEASERTRKDRDAKVKNLNGRLNAALSELQQRPSRSTSSPTDTASCSGATGANLSKEDAEFLVRESTRADTVVEQLNYCIAQYQSLTK